MGTSFFKDEKSKKGLLIVVSGPSGSGKGTVLPKVLARRKGIFFSVSATTRKPRPGEINGKHYYFLSHEEFEEKIRNGGMLEYASYCGNYYGTPRFAVEEKLAGGFDVILEIEVQGAKLVKNSCPDCIAIFIAPPSEEELEKRLRGRGTECEDVIKKRLETSVGEIRQAFDYDYIVVNDDVETAAGKIDSIITAEKCRSSKAELNKK
ncbi:MAG TPA: guanylate kinase [Ruminiclostridium sp.]|nr:guanylate kinase [Ruminiclostridium sp.]